MQEHEILHSGCICNAMPRRHFLTTGCAVCATGGLLATLCQNTPTVSANAASQKTNAMRIRIFFALHSPVQEQPDWPNLGFDFRPVISRVVEQLNAACNDIEFIPSMVNGAQATEQILTEDAELDGTDHAIQGYFVMQLNCWNQCVQSCVATQKPVLYVDFQFAGSGGFLVYTAGLLRAEAKNFGFIGSSKFEDVILAAQCFKTITAPNEFAEAVAKVRKERTPLFKLAVKEDPVDCLPIPELLEKIRGLKLIAIGGMMGGNLVESTKSELGIDVLAMDYQEINALWEKADRNEAAEIVQKWKSPNTVISDDVSDETLERSARMAIAMRQMLEKYGAQGITMNCLGGFYGKQIQAYPCLGFHEILNTGKVGACECDIRSSITMLVMSALTQGRPGYISDPIIDTAKNQIVYAHCVSSNKVFGPNGPSNPMEILTHSEDRAGASVRSIVPVNGMLTTTVEFSPDRKELLFHQAIAVENDPDDRACRTKIGAVPLGNIEKLYTQWDHYGWHRVTYYGDLKAEVFAIADALGWTVCEEA
ncbi:MAG: hypothetical protein PHE53_02365 [Thermoguttaceae bacterium]|nr:hypothetical protein [Thermoguttaceae bacterium]